MHKEVSAASAVTIITKIRSRREKEREFAGVERAYSESFSEF
jgi:hypothetical protein